ncbi:MAG: glycosyltransferase family 4 protein [Chthoniobacterales bacterium]|nr:glycosyltransferase family 4 protein [Chthoniobacterales bacterium]
MNILYDTYIFKLQKAGGINRYISDIISNLPSTFHPFFFRKTTNKIHIPNNSDLKFFWLPKQLSRSSWLLDTRLRSIDVIHTSYYQITPPLTWDNIPGKVVVTVYDFIMARFPHRLEKSSKVISSQTAAIKRANHIICISEATRNDLLERFPECEKKSSVIYLASSLSPPPNSIQNPYQQRYFIFVGNRDSYKNFDLTLNAFALLKVKNKDLRLVIIGSFWNEKEEQQVKELGIWDSVDLIENPNDQTLAILYKYAEALIYPSEYEGFGLPPLEAMTMGTSVIALKTSSLPEVVGSSGILINPLQASPGAIAEAASSLLNASVEERNNSSLKAIEQASRFSLEKTLQETVAIYQQFQ